MRIAIAPGQDGARPLAVADPQARLQGRGAYLCRNGEGGPEGACLALAVRRGGFARALRAPVTLDREIVESVVS
jgi:predicted RNA-binding protein YlxR (DUF448 family)